MLRVLCLLPALAVVAQVCNDRQDAVAGACVCKDGLTLKGGQCVLTPELQTARGGDTTTSKVVLQADQVAIKTWDETAKTVVERDVLGELDQVKTTVNGATQMKIDAVSTQVATIADDYVQTSDLTSAITNSEANREMVTKNLQQTVSYQIGNVSADVSSIQDSLVNYATLDQLQGLNTDVKTETTSGPCNTTNLRVVRYNTVTQQHEICAKSNVVENVYYWNPQGAPANCVVFDGSKCTQCIDEYIVDNNVCVMVADFIHLAFDNNLYDMSPYKRHVLLGNTADNFQFKTGRDGSPAIELDGVDDYLYFEEPLYFGGAVSVCFDAMYKSIGGWVRALDFAQGTPGGTNPSSSNFIIAMQQNTYNLRVESYIGKAGTSVNFADVWGPAHGGWVEMCVTVDEFGNVTAYQNGEIKGTGKINPISYVPREAAYIGRSNWDGNSYADALFDNFRMWTKVLPAAQIQAAFAQGRPEKNWKGLYGAFHLDGNLNDAGAARWEATAANTLPFNFWRIGGAEGSGYANFDGNNDLISLNKRWFGGAMSVCMHVKYNAFTAWTRLFHFFTAADTDEIQLFNRDNSSDVYFEIKNSATGTSIQVPNGFAAAQGAFQHVCVTITEDGEGSFYRQGMFVLANGALGLPKNGLRETCYIARAQGDSANLNGAIDDFRVYNRALNAAEVEDVLCQGRPNLDCVGLLGHYPFDGDSRDASTNAWHGSIVPSTAQAMNNFFTTDAKVGSGAARFEGSDGYIRLPGRQFGGAFSVAVWIKISSGQQYSRILDFGNGANAGNVVMMQDAAAATDFSVEVYNPGRARFTVTDYFKDLSNTWVHVGMTIAEDGTINVYKNGQLSKTGTLTSVPYAFRTQNYFAESNWDNSVLTGALDDLRIYNKVLTAAEVTTLFNLGS